MTPQGPPFYGKYRGIVSDNQDPLFLGRIRAKVLDIYGDQESGWALPALPYAGNQVGLFLVPPVDAHVWIEFEGGNPEYPVWTGCFWAQGEVPVTPALPAVKVLKTDVGSLTLDDTPGIGGITLETTAGMKIALTASGIELSNGQGSIKITGPQISLNNGALEVT
ncbi:baseplate assembly protein [filamentous cyanobacterium CCP3]|nr:baseplate assembly protein [filamentous cyanobacterium CCP3]